MTVEELMNSKYAEKFGLEFGKIAPNVLTIQKPQYMTIGLNDGYKIEEHSTMVFIRNSTASITLYYESGDTHTTII